MKDTQLRHTLGEDHQAIRELLESLASAADTNDYLAVSSALRDVEQRLRHHIEGEERFVFSPLERQHPAEIAELRGEHRQLLRTLDELSIDAELHALRKERIDRFIEALQAHAQREDGAVYQWAARRPHETEHSMAGFVASVRSRLDRARPDET